MAHNKEFGKLSADQLLQLIQLLPQLESMSREFRKDLKSHPKVRAGIAEDPAWWAPLYELPYEQHLGLFLKTVNMDKVVIEDRV